MRDNGEVDYDNEQDDREKCLHGLVFAICRSAVTPNWRASRLSVAMSRAPRMQDCHIAVLPFSAKHLLCSAKS
jgi:hypothetical protein